MENKTPEIGFTLLKITTEQFAVFEDSFKENTPVMLNNNLQFGIDKEKRMIGVFPTFIFTIEGKPFLSIKVGCHFGIKEESWKQFLNPDKNIVIVPKGFITHLAVLTVGTARGVLHTRTENTIFNKFVLPPINVAEMITTDVTFE